ncbi:hypothetical protein I6A60_19155 [Frankia sp. AgB1.9]|nr:hypothetical protein [Frankia sp. AgW1.1]MBL7549979.1 hypothetical protein [Frankia sp. AgB1.9]MBL7621443.1 hypothetical protein [Frankia sp. AgB1.8]
MSGGVDTVFHETSAEPRVEAVPLAHLSVELGHLYMEDLTAPDADLGAHFARIAPWVDPPRLAAVARVPQSRLRVSTCLLIDDYFSAPGSPADVIGQLVTAAAGAGLRVDYIARESACATAPRPAAPTSRPTAGGAGSFPADDDGEISLAALVEAALVADPPFGATGVRPTPAQIGWLSNGERTPGADGARPAAAMAGETRWAPPRENAARRHSVFVDVELWDVPRDARVWSCPMLAGVWQLLRLGLLRVAGRSAVNPVRMDVDALPTRWAELPPVIQLADRVAPFCAYRAMSVLDSRFFPVEHAVRTILAQVATDPVVAEQALTRAGQEGTPLPRAVPDRLSYVFLGS